MTEYDRVELGVRVATALANENTGGGWMREMVVCFRVPPRHPGYYRGR